MTDLDKWPRLLVVGKPVTPEQANDILIRTDSWILCLNDRAWTKAAYRVAGVVLAHYGMPGLEELRDFRARMGVLDLAYMANVRIGSSWIGGPHGWCDWNGWIGCAAYNVGTWPSHEQVTDDWRQIAAAWPFLDLVAQLVTDDGEGDLAGQWTVRGGQVQFDPAPAELIRPAEEVALSAIAMLAFRSEVTGREQGVPMRRLVAALDQVRQSQSQPARADR